MTDLRPVTVEIAHARSLPGLYARHPRHDEPQPVAMLCRYDGQALRPTDELLFEDGCKRVLRGEDSILVAEGQGEQPAVVVVLAGGRAPVLRTVKSSRRSPLQRSP